MRAHELKGLAPTFGYPLIQELAASLCSLVDEDRLPLQQRLPLIDDHIDAIRTLAEKRIRAAMDPVGRALVGQLASDVHNLLDDVG